MFERSLDLVEECGLTHLHVFPFSPRPGTPAARMPQVPRRVVKERASSGKGGLMAFGFIKKVFSFGRKEVEEVPTEEAQPPAPGTAAEAAPVIEPKPQPSPSRGEAAPEQDAEKPVEGPVPEFLVADSTAPEATPAEQPPAPPVEEPPAPAEIAPAAPPSEIPPPLRQVEPIHADPLREEIAPEPSPIPEPASQEAVRLRVGKAVERAEAPAAQPEPVVPAAPRVPWFQRLREGLSRSSRELGDQIAGVFNKRRLDEDTLQDLEDVLIRADLGVDTAMRVTDALSASRYGKDVSSEEVRAIMAAEIEKVLAPVALPLELDLSHKPHVILVVGVNGTGKTTTIGKLAAKLTDGGLSVMLAAGDTFRAAAIEQLKIWGERTKSPVVASKLGADAAGLAWDAFEKAKSAGSDVLIIDTAGRLQNKAELMAELEKIVRVLGRHDPEAPHTVLQTVDATTGQNALNQVEIFKNVAGVNGLVMTKLDGTARGGILVAIAAKHGLPVYFIGVGEQVDDLEPFSAGDFAKAIAGVSE
jgi:fused signal recognition particle receptor